MGFTLADLFFLYLFVDLLFHSFILSHDNEITKPFIMQRARKPHNAIKIMCVCAHIYVQHIYRYCKWNCRPFKGLFLHFCKIRSTVGGCFLEDKVKDVAKKNFISLAL